MITGVAQRISPPVATPMMNCGTLGSSKPSIDWEGRRLAMESDLPLNLVDNNANLDVYVFDLDSTLPVRVSEDPRTGHDGFSTSSRPRISGNGKQVAYVSQSTNIESSEADNNDAADVLVFAVDARQARRASNNRRGDQAKKTSGRPAMSYDGNYLVFDSDAENLQLSVTTGQSIDANNKHDVYHVLSPFITRGGPDTTFLDSFESR
jgi:Tol biopolymer transport system component